MYVTLLQAISIQNQDFQSVNLSEGETIFVDVESNVAWFDDVVFEIEPSEYTLRH